MQPLQPLGTYGQRPNVATPAPKKQLSPLMWVGLIGGGIAIMGCCVIGSVASIVTGVMMTSTEAEVVTSADGSGSSEAAEPADLGIELKRRKAELIPAPANWKVMLDEPVPPATEWNAKIPEGFRPRTFLTTAPGVGEGAVILQQYLSDVSGPDPFSYSWLRIDPLSGDALGDAIELWTKIDPPPQPEGMDYNPANNLDAELPIAALTDDGKTLAIRHPFERQQVIVRSSDGASVWDARPYGDANVEWVGWNPDGALLTVGQGKFSAWKMPEGTKVFEVGSDYGSYANRSPRGRWVAVAGAKTIDILDSASGNVLGSLAIPDRLVGAIGGMDLTDDGRYLAIARKYEQGRYGSPQGTEAPTAGVVATWDLSTGAMRDHWILAVENGTADWGLRWHDERRLLFGKDLFDLDYGLPLVRYGGGVEEIPLRIGGKFVLPEPNEGLYAAKSVSLKEFLEPQTAAALPKYPPQEGGAMLPGTSIAIDVDSGDVDRDGEALAILTKMYEAEGYVVKPDAAWKVRIEARAGASGEQLTSPGGRSVNTPIVVVQNRLIDPAGEVVDDLQTMHGSSGTDSVYYDETRPAVGGVGTEDLYDYGGRDPYEAMTEEAWANWLGDLPRLKTPRTAVKTVHGYETLPMLRQNRLPKVDGLGKSSSLLDPESHYYWD